MAIRDISALGLNGKIPMAYSNSWCNFVNTWRRLLGPQHHKRANFEYNSTKQKKGDWVLKWLAYYAGSWNYWTNAFGDVSMSTLKQYLDGIGGASKFKPRTARVYINPLWWKFYSSEEMPRWSFRWLLPSTQCLWLFESFILRDQHPELGNVSVHMTMPGHVDLILGYSPLANFVWALGLLCCT